MSWGGNNSGGGAWESNTAAISAWGPAHSAPADEEPTATVTDTNGSPEAEADGGASDSPAPDVEATEVASGNAPVKGAAPEWLEQDQLRYNYEELGIRDGEYDGSARVYHWDGEDGDIGPEFPELEAEIFGPPEDRGIVFGPEIAMLTEIQVTQEGPVRTVPTMSFAEAQLHPAMRKNIDLCGYKIPTTIQKYCLSAIGLGHDVIGISQTGSGKTAAYLIPILNKLMGKAKKLAAPRPNPAEYRAGFDPVVRAEPLVCIVCPTRELAIQIFMEARKLCYRSMLRPCVVYGGGPLRYQIDQLALGCDILIATPGRLIDFMDRPNNLTLRRLKYMVIDEADEMLHGDWEEDLNKILGGGEQDVGNIQYMLFSATFPKNLRELATTHLTTDHVRFSIGRAGSTHANIRQVIMDIGPANKRQACLDLLNSMPPARTIIFVNSKRAADELDDYLFNEGMPTTSIHADRTQREREDAMRAFRGGKSPILIATGISARGIDVRNIVHVINYDLPPAAHGGIEEYTHRIGRTGRIGHRGLATSFFNERDEDLASVLVRTLLETGQEIPDFLAHHIPEGEDLKVLKFESENELGGAFGDEAEGGAWAATGGEDAGTGGWGAPTPAAAAAKESVGGDRGAPIPAASAW
ncbi:unnamed protein product [Discula destructiva]